MCNYSISHHITRQGKRDRETCLDPDENVVVNFSALGAKSRTQTFSARAQQRFQACSNGRTEYTNSRASVMGLFVIVSKGVAIRLGMESMHSPAPTPA